MSSGGARSTGSVPFVLKRPQGTYPSSPELSLSLLLRRPEPSSCDPLAYTYRSSCPYLVHCSRLELGQSAKKGFWTFVDLTLRSGTRFLCPQSLVLCARYTIVTFSDSIMLYSVVLDQGTHFAVLGGQVEQEGLWASVVC